MTDPVRILTTTLSVDKSNSQRLPVRSDKGIPKTKLLDCMKELKSIRVSKPVQIGQIIVENILDTGVNIIASRSLWIQPREGDNG
jgi:CxxC motif-containing protein